MTRRTYDDRLLNGRVLKIGGVDEFDLVVK